jgi:hypothetical protein
MVTLNDLYHIAMSTVDDEATANLIEKGVSSLWERYRWFVLTIVTLLAIIIVMLGFKAESISSYLDETRSRTDQVISRADSALRFAEEQRHSQSFLEREQALRKELQEGYHDLQNDRGLMFKNQTDWLQSQMTLAQASTRNAVERLDRYESKTDALAEQNSCLQTRLDSSEGELDRVKSTWNERMESAVRKHTGLDTTVSRIDKELKSLAARSGSGRSTAESIIMVQSDDKKIFPGTALYVQRDDGGFMRVYHGDKKNELRSYFRPDSAGVQIDLGPAESRKLVLISMSEPWEIELRPK